MGDASQLSFPLKAGDWLCPSCGDHQFATRPQCRRCGTQRRPDAASIGPLPMPVFAVSAGSAASTSLAPSVVGTSIVLPPSHAIGRPVPVSAAPGLALNWFCMGCKSVQASQLMTCGNCGAARPPSVTSPSTANALAAMVGLGPSTVSPATPSFNIQHLRAMAAAGQLQAATFDQAPQPVGTLTGAVIPNQGAFSAAAAQAAVAANQTTAPALEPRGFKRPRAGDWQCPMCRSFTPSMEKLCKQCGVEPPRKRVVEPGDWFCNNCSDIQWRKNVRCRKCGMGRPTAKQLAAAAAAEGKAVKIVDR